MAHHSFLSNISQMPKYTDMKLRKAAKSHILETRASKYLAFLLDKWLKQYIYT